MSSVSIEAATKLRSRPWRRWNSWWVWVPLVDFGFLGWLGFVFAWVRTRDRRYGIAAAVFGAFVVAGFVLITADNERDTILADLGAVAVLVSMIGGAVVAGIWKPDYLVKVAERQVLHGDIGVSRSVGAPPVPPSAAQQGFLGVSGADYYGGPPRGELAASRRPAVVPASRCPNASTARTDGSSAHSSLICVYPEVDVNAATAEQLVAKLAVSPEIAARVVEGRAVNGRYANLEDLVSGAGLQPHELVRFRNRITFGGGQAPPPPSSWSSGRVLDF